MAIYKCDRGVTAGSAVKQIQKAVRAVPEPGTSGFQVRRPNPSATAVIKCNIHMPLGLQVSVLSVLVRKHFHYKALLFVEVQCNCVVPGDFSVEP